MRIIVPDFPSRILQTELERMGFENVSVVEWEREFVLDDQVRLAFLRPVSLFEDASCLVGVANWYWLNQNDAGAALRDELLPEMVDLLTMSFDVGASGWPLTWDLGEKRSGAILRSQKMAHFESIKSRCRQTAAKFFAPFAGWWRHALDTHQKFASQLPHTTHEDLRGVFAGENTELLPTLPSSVITLCDMSHEWNANVADLLQAPVPRADFTPPTPTLGSQLRPRFMSYMHDLTMLSLATACEAVEFIVSVPEIGLTESFHFGPARDTLTTISVEIPVWVAEALVLEDSTATWNHFDIGYWCKWSRDPDIYAPNFTRLLSLGYAQQIFSNQTVVPAESILNKAVADFIEINPSAAKTIFNRAGLPCVACNRANSDSLANAFEIHQVPDGLRAVATAELSALLSGPRN